MKSLRSRLTLGLVTIIVFFLVQGGLVWWGQASTGAKVVNTARINTLASSKLGELAVLAQQIRRYEKEYFVYVGNEERRNAYVKEWTAAADKMTAMIGAMRTTHAEAFTSEEVKQIALWGDAADFYQKEMAKIFAAVDANASQTLKIAEPAPAVAPPAAPASAAKAAAATKAGAPAEPATPAAAATTVATYTPAQVNTMIGAGKDRLSSVLIKGVSDMTALKNAQTLALAQVASDGFERVFLGVMVTVAVGILIALGLMVLLPAAVVRPIRALTEAVDQLSKGKLENKVDTVGVAEFDDLSVALERLRLGQQALLTRVRAKSSQA